MSMSLPPWYPGSAAGSGPAPGSAPGQVPPLPGSSTTTGSQETQDVPPIPGDGSGGTGGGSTPPPPAPPPVMPPIETAAQPTPTGIGGTTAAPSFQASLKPFRTPGFSTDRQMFGASTAGVPVVGGIGGVGGSILPPQDQTDDRQRQALNALLSAYFQQ